MLLRFALPFAFVSLLLTFVQSSKEPSLVIRPDKVTRSLSQAVFATCSPNVANNGLLSQIKWRGPGDRKIPTEDGSIFIKGESLYIKNLKADDVGVYTCSALYDGKQRLEAEMEVLSYRSLEFNGTDSIQTWVKGTDAKIKCIVSSYPPPIVDWSKDGIKFTGDPQHIIQRDGILIKEIDMDDEGVYRCRARIPALGELNYIDIQVHVHEIPEITDNVTISDVQQSTDGQEQGIGTMKNEDCQHSFDRVGQGCLLVASVLRLGWETSRQFCKEAFGADLMIFRDAKELLEITTYLADKKYNDTLKEHPFWLGATHDKSNAYIHLVDETHIEPNSLLMKIFGSQSTVKSNSTDSWQCYNMYYSEPGSLQAAQCGNEMIRFMPVCQYFL